LWFSPITPPLVFPCPRQRASPFSVALASLLQIADPISLASARIFNPVRRDVCSYHIIDLDWRSAGGNTATAASSCTTVGGCWLDMGAAPFPEDVHRSCFRLIEPTDTN
jgi:hypothetical protein